MSSYIVYHKPIDTQMSPGMTGSASKLYLFNLGQRGIRVCDSGFLGGLGPQGLSDAHVISP